MAKYLLQKTLDGKLRPTDDEGDNALRKLKVGSEVWVELRKARNPKHHRQYFALLHLVYDNQERYTSFDHFRAAVQMQAGHVEWIAALDGCAVPLPKSIDYSSLDEIQFSKVFSETMAVCVNDFLKGVELDDLRAEVGRYAA